MNPVRLRASGSSPIVSPHISFAWYGNTNALGDFVSSPWSTSIDFELEIGTKTEGQSGISERTFQKNGGLQDESMSIRVDRLTNLTLDAETNSGLVNEDEELIECP
jgi:hypothetical protein